MAPFIPEDSLHYLTAGMLFLSAVFMMIKLFVLKEDAEQQPLSSRQLLIRGIILGLVSGMLSGMFGIDQHHLFKWAFDFAEAVY